MKRNEQVQHRTNKYTAFFKSNIIDRSKTTISNKTVKTIIISRTS
jgi:hypothetical protein